MPKSRRSKACDIPTRVKREVLERDGGHCIVCGKYGGIPNAHFISRADGGLGIAENIVSLCLGCHRAYDGEERGRLRPVIADYLRGIYPHWDEKKLVYSKWREQDV